MAIKHNLKDGVYLIDESHMHIQGSSKIELDKDTFHLLDDVKQGFYEHIHQIDNMSAEELNEASRYFDDEERMLFYALEQCSMMFK